MTVVDAGAELFAGFGSSVDETTDAVAVTVVPGVSGWTTIEAVTIAPAAIGPMLQVTGGATGPSTQLP
jgi:hypothetical protein